MRLIRLPGAASGQPAKQFAGHAGLDEGGVDRADRPRDLDAADELAAHCDQQVLDEYH